MQKVLEGLKELRNLSGNAQIEHLRMIKTDLLKEVLEYTYNTQKKYKIDEKKYSKVSGSIGLLTSCAIRDFSLQDWKQFTEILDELIELRSATDRTVAKVKNFIETITEEECRDFLKMVLFKDLRLGLNCKTCQKVWPDFCVTYPYMGCKSFSMNNLKRIVYPAFAQTKMDGSFCNVIVDMDNNKVEYVSRQSKSQPIKGCLDKELLSQFVTPDERFTSKYVLTGEVLVWDNEKNKPLPRKISNGILRRKDKTQQELDNIHLVCWDFLPYNKFLEKRWEVPYKDRFEWLSTRIKSDRIHVVNTWIVNNIDEAMKRFEKEYEKGEEGVVIKSFNQIWQDGKPSGQVKIKAEKECDLKMVEFFEGKGAYSGMCGSIRCISEDNLLEVNIKPRTPDDAILIWNNQEKYINKILSVKYNEKIQSDTKQKLSLYLPEFVEIRDDKIIADTLDVIE